MAIELTLSNGSRPLEFEKGLLPDYNGPKIRGAIALSAKTNCGQLVIQELKTEEYSIRLSVIKFLKTITATGSLSRRGLYTIFLLKNGLRKEFKPIGKLHLRQDQYSCFFTEPTTCKTRLERNTELRVLDIFYTPQFLEELLPYFPELKQVLSDTATTVLPEKKCWMLPSMNEIINQILYRGPVLFLSVLELF